MYVFTLIHAPLYILYICEFDFYVYIFFYPTQNYKQRILSRILDHLMKK